MTRGGARRSTSRSWPRVAQGTYEVRDAPWSPPARRLAVRLRAQGVVPLLPKRALVLAQELLTRGVQAIKADQWDTPQPA